MIEPGPGHGGKWSQKQEAAIAALLAAPTIGAAAAACGVSEPTLNRWLQIPAFRERLALARQEVFTAALQELKSAAGDAVSTLRELLKSDLDAIRLRAAVAILEQAHKGKELLELEGRLAALEQLQKAQEQAESYAGARRIA